MTETRNTQSAAGGCVHEESVRPGALYVVSTPIGNLGDFSPRGVWALANVERIAAEDTRRTSQLLARYGLRTPMLPYHEHNARRVLPELLDTLRNGHTLALVSDAGTPGVSDPGYRLITAAADEGIEIVPIPGASALLAAIVAAGLPTDRFAFEGFLPKKKGRSTRLKELARESRTVALFEAPGRVARTLADLSEHLGVSRRAAVCRELTKTFEEVVRGTLGDLAKRYEENAPKGEIVIVVEGLTRRVQQDEDRGGADEREKHRARHEFPIYPGDEDEEDKA